MTLLRVGFNAYLLHAPELRGWTRYTLNLLAALPAHGVRPVLYSRGPLHPAHLARLPEGSFEVRIAPPMRYVVWENWWVPRQLQRDRIQVFHCPMNYGMPWVTPCPRVLTLHDAINQIYYGQRATFRQEWRPAAVRNRLSHWVARQRADHIIAVSEHAKEDIVRYLKVPRRKVSVVYEAADPVFHQRVTSADLEALQSKWNLTLPYFLYLGGWEGRKNVPFLIRAFAAVGLPGVELVLAGGKETERTELLKLASELGCTDRLRLLGFVPDEELPALYRGATAFVYPSEYEGFGLQLVEAMAVGCPVFAARATCLPEIVGRGGVTFDLSGPRELTSLIQRAATSVGFREELTRRGTCRSADFSWDRTANATAAIYRQLVQL